MYQLTFAGSDLKFYGKSFLDGFIHTQIIDDVLIEYRYSFHTFVGDLLHLE